MYSVTYSQLLPDVSVDAMDLSGEHQLDVDHNIYKKRLGPDGKAIAIEKGGRFEILAKSRTLKAEHRS